MRLGGFNDVESLFCVNCCYVSDELVASICTEQRSDDIEKNFLPRVLYCSRPSECSGTLCFLNEGLFNRRKLSAILFFVRIWES